jgi:hypothetical protein
MTQDKARKSAIRQRMAATGKPYSVARHAVRDDNGGAGGPEVSRHEDDWDGGVAAEPGPGPTDAGPGMADNRSAEAGPQEQARQLAEQARQRAEHARMRAERADEAATAAEGPAWEVEDGPEFRHHRSYGPPRPPQPPRPPRPPRLPHHGHGEPHEHEDPVDRLQDQLKEVLARFDQVRDRADWLVSAAERILPGRGETSRAGTAPAQPAGPESASGEPSSGEPEPTEPTESA